jgi:hypothetical protein
MFLLSSVVVVPLLFSLVTDLFVVCCSSSSSSSSFYVCSGTCPCIHGSDGSLFLVAQNFCELRVFLTAGCPSWRRGIFIRWNQTPDVVYRHTQDMFAVAIIIVNLFVVAVVDVVICNTTAPCPVRQFISVPAAFKLSPQPFINVNGTKSQYPCRKSALLRQSLASWRQYDDVTAPTW